MRLIGCPTYEGSYVDRDGKYWVGSAQSSCRAVTYKRVANTAEGGATRSVQSNEIMIELVI